MAGARINYTLSGSISLFKAAARSAAALQPPYEEALLALDADWGNPALWALLPFVVLAVAGVWFAFQRSYHDGAIIEDLTLTPTLVTLTRHGPQGRRQDWQANPHWVRVVLHPTAGPVPNYLTLRGNNREVELGAFLSEDERIALADDLRQRLAALR